MLDVTVITPAIPERLHLLNNCVESVRDQTIQPRAHLIRLDNERIGSASTCNRLVEAVDTEWIAFLADDDVFYPNHLETLVGGSDDNVSVVYSWCKVVGRVKHPAWNPNAHFDPVRLRTGNYIPSTTLVRTSHFRELGGFTDGIICEDWDLWLRILEEKGGMAFKCIPKITWEYRFYTDENGQPLNISDGWSL